MKQLTIKDIVRLEKKINLLNDKLDRLMEAQDIKLEKTPEQTDKEEVRKRKMRERQQTKIIKTQQIEMQVEKMMEDVKLQYAVGYDLQRQFNLLTRPSADRIRLYQRTNDPKAFNGLKRRTD